MAPTLPVLGDSSRFEIPLYVHPLDAENTRHPGTDGECSEAAAIRSRRRGQDKFRARELELDFFRFHPLWALECVQAHSSAILSGRLS